MKEKDIEIILWDWLKTKGENIEEVYFNRKNELDWITFRVEGSQEKVYADCEKDQGWCQK